MADGIKISQLTQYAGKQLSDVFPFSGASPFGSYSWTVRTFLNLGLTGLTGGGATNLDGWVTAHEAVGQMFNVVGSDNLFSPYQLQQGVLAQSLPNVVRPLDFDSGNNPKIFQLTGIKATKLVTTGVGGDGYVELADQSGSPSMPSSAHRLYSDSSHRPAWIQPDGFTRTFSGAPTDHRVYTLPDASGTVALTNTNCVPSIAGTANQILVNGDVTAVTGSAVTLSLPTTLVAINSITSASTADLILANGTSDGSDNHTLYLNGGGSNALTSRGAYIALRGNEVSTFGANVEIYSGISGRIDLFTNQGGGDVSKLGISNAGDTTLFRNLTLAGSISGANSVTSVVSTYLPLTGNNGSVLTLGNGASGSTTFSGGTGSRNIVVFAGAASGSQSGFTLFGANTATNMDYGQLISYQGNRLELSTGANGSATARAITISPGGSISATFSVGGAIAFGSSSIVSVANSTAASSTTTGALQVTGGISTQSGFYAPVINVTNASNAQIVATTSASSSSYAQFIANGTNVAAAVNASSPTNGGTTFGQVNSNTVQFTGSGSSLVAVLIGASTNVPVIFGTNNAEVLRLSGTTTTLAGNLIVTGNVTASTASSSGVHLVANNTTTSSETSLILTEDGISTKYAYLTRYGSTHASKASIAEFGLAGGGRWSFAQGAVTIVDTTTSTTTASGSLINSGGFGNAGTSWFGDTLNVTKSNSGAAFGINITNSSNTATSHSQLQLVNGGTSGGSSQVLFSMTGETNFYVGAQAGSARMALGTSVSSSGGHAMRIDTSLNVNFPQAAQVVTFSGTTAATSTTTGALQVVGGVGVQGSGYFGTSLLVQGGGSPTWQTTSTARFSDNGGGAVEVNATNGHSLIQFAAGSTYLGNILTESAGSILRITAGTSMQLRLAGGDSDNGLLISTAGNGTLTGNLAVSGTGTHTFAGTLAISSASTNVYFRATSAEPVLDLVSNASSSINYQIAAGGGGGFSVGKFAIYDATGGYTILEATKATGSNTVKRISISAAGDVTFGSTTSASSTTTGALIVGSNGVSLGGNGAIWAHNGSLNSDGDLTLTVGAVASNFIRANGPIYQSIVSAGTELAGITVINNSNTSGSHASITVQNGGSSGGNPWYHLSNAGTNDMYMGVDRATGRYFVGTSGSNSGGDALRIDRTSLALTLGINGQSVSSWTTTGVILNTTGATYTNSSTAASGTAATATFVSFAAPILAATNANVTTNDAATFYIAGGPTQGTNQTIVRPWSMWAKGNTLFGDQSSSGFIAAEPSSTDAILTLGSLAQANYRYIQWVYGSARTLQWKMGYYGGTNSSFFISPASGTAISIAQSDAQVTMNSTTASTSTTTGSLINSGGFGNAGKGFFGDSVSATNSFLLTKGSSTAQVALAGGGNEVLNVGNSNANVLTVVVLGNVSTGTSASDAFAAYGSTNSATKLFNVTHAGNATLTGTITNGGRASLVSNATYSLAAWALAGGYINCGQNSTITDSTSSGTVATMALYSMSPGTVAASSSTTYTIATTMWVGAPNAGSNVTFGTSYGIWDAGGLRVDGTSTFNQAIAVTSGSFPGITSSNTSAGIDAGAIYQNNQSDHYSILRLKNTGGTACSYDLAVAGSAASNNPGGLLFFDSTASLTILKFAVTTGVATFGCTTEATIAGAGSIVTPGGIYASKAIIANGNLITSTQTPSSAAATGIAGTITWDSSFIYVCTATNTWKRVGIATW